MNRSTRMLVAVSMPVIAMLVLLLNVRLERPDQRQEVVQQYVSRWRAKQEQALRIDQYVQASMPQNFHAKMSHSSFGSGIYYQAQHQFNEPRPPDFTFPLKATLPPTLTGKSMSGRPVPYPPTDLWCVQLTGADSITPHVILVGLHQDIYNAEWIVHEMTDPATVLPAVGCSYPLP